MTLIPQDALDWLVALLRDGRDYYRHAAEHTGDAEVRRAFELAAEARDALLAELRALPPDAASIPPGERTRRRSSSGSHHSASELSRLTTERAARERPVHAMRK